MFTVSMRWEGLDLFTVSITWEELDLFTEGMRWEGACKHKVGGAGLFTITIVTRVTVVTRIAVVTRVAVVTRLTVVTRVTVVTREAVYLCVEQTKGNQRDVKTGSVWAMADRAVYTISSC